MREIKFRAWDKVIGKWHYSNKYPSMWQFFRALEDLGIHHFECYQYTGLKDKNSKEAYLLVSLLCY
ncbi:hypothetical protein LCGC14_2157620 [marine sediment metagenome]|uniref:YopX protein domain-containing protein n=1 Tax=marine sediment metagenome TaxID=412755 RepID=A0A0F9EFX0_9ZZZZ